MEKKLRKNSHVISYFSTSSGVSEVSKRANELAQQRARAKRAVQSKRTSERCERTSERTSEWPSTYVLIFCSSRPQWSVRGWGECGADGCEGENYGKTGGGREDRLKDSKIVAKARRLLKSAQTDIFAHCFT